MIMVGMNAGVVVINRNSWMLARLRRVGPSTATATASSTSARADCSHALLTSIRTAPSTDPTSRKFSTHGVPRQVCQDLISSQMESSTAVISQRSSTHGECARSDGARVRQCATRCPRIGSSSATIRSTVARSFASRLRRRSGSVLDMRMFAHHSPASMERRSSS